MLDQVQNFIKEVVVGTHVLADTTVNVVDASLFPDPASGEYNLTWWDATNYPDPSDDPLVEIVRVTGRDTGLNTLTVTRAQEGTSATDKNTGGATYLLALCPTKKTMDDIDTRIGLITPASASAPASLDLAEDTDNGTNKITLTAPSAIASDKVLTLPDATDTLVGKDTSDTLTNKIYQLADGQGTNYQITSSIATDDITVSLKTLAGTDPSSTDRSMFSLGNSLIEIAQAISVTITDAMGDIFAWDNKKIQGNDAQLFVYAINNNGTLQLGISPSPNLRVVATNYYDAGGQTGAAGHTNIVMSGTRNATNSCRVIGRINVHQTDANLWQAPTTALSINEPIFETDELTWTPDLTVDASDISAYTLAKYKIKATTLEFLFQATSGASASMTGAGTGGFTLPVLAVNSLVPFNAFIYGGASYAWAICWNASTANARFWKSGATAWSGGETGVQVYIKGIYTI